MTNNIVII